VPLDDVAQRQRVQTPEESTGEVEQTLSFADPLSNIRARETRPTGFQYNPNSDLKKLI
jgi:hypothetical protein